MNIILPNIIEWAITRAGYDYQDYIDKHDNVRKWACGEKQPTLKQIETFAHTLHVPLGYLFLDTPPVEEMPIPMFRRSKANLNIEVFDMVNIISDRQQWLRQYLVEEGAEELQFVGKHRTDNNAGEICATMRQVLSLPIDWATKLQTTEEALNKLASVMEEHGVMVNFNSIVGNSTHRTIAVEDCRGFALVDKYAPFIFVNSKDAKSAQLFTLAHEFAHILVGYSAGIGDIDIEDSPVTERLCDTVAAEFLMPKSLFEILWVNNHGDFEYISRKAKVSKYVVARCAKDYGYISEQAYLQNYNRWQQEPNPPKKGTGGDFYINTIRRTGRTFLLYVNSALGSNRILHTEAYRLAGLKGDTYRKVFASQYIYR
ncbi:MAG: ImmA/IrrE family metallo-endopeptidase [Bacteroidales bacterium]|nr:ImmA/IrrE family metallo-endopeptidase [Bacteroidales bacterium]